MPIDQALIDKLNQLLADHPASVTRLISTPDHNAQVGGAAGSAHVQGKAVDLVFDSYQELVTASAFALTLGFGGVELDLTNQHLHLDTMPRVWQVVHHGPGQEGPLDQWLLSQV